MCNGLQAQAEKKRSFKTDGKNNKVLNALIEKKFQKFVKNKKRRKTKNYFSTSRKCRFRTTNAKRVSLAWQKAWKVEKSLPLIPNKN